MKHRDKLVTLPAYLFAVSCSSGLKYHQSHCPQKSYQTYGRVNRKWIFKVTLLFVLHCRCSVVCGGRAGGAACPVGDGREGWSRVALGSLGGRGGAVTSQGRPGIVLGNLTFFSFGDFYPEKFRGIKSATLQLGIRPARPPDLQFGGRKKI